MHTQFFQVVFSFHVKFQTHSDCMSDNDKTIEGLKIVLFQPNVRPWCYWILDSKWMQFARFEI